MFKCIVAGFDVSRETPRLEVALDHLREAASDLALETKSKTQSQTEPDQDPESDSNKDKMAALEQVCSYCNFIDCLGFLLAYVHTSHHAFTTAGYYSMQCS